MSAKRKRKQPVKNTTATEGYKPEVERDSSPALRTTVSGKVDDENGEFWRPKYERLLEMRTTEVEQRLIDMNKKAEEQSRASDELVNALQSQLAQMEMRLPTSTKEVGIIQQEQNNMNTGDSELSTSNPTESAAKLSKMEAVVGFYNLLTGIVIEQKNTSDTFDSFCCSFSNGPSAHAFMLHHDKVQQEIEFNPSLSDDSLTPRKRGRSIGRKILPLPEFLNEDIYFEVEEAPRFLFRILRSIHESQQPMCQ